MQHYKYKELDYNVELYAYLLHYIYTHATNTNPTTKFGLLHTE